MTAAALDLVHEAARLGRVAAASDPGASLYPSLGAFIAFEAELRRSGGAVNSVLYEAFVRSFEGARRRAPR